MYRILAKLLRTSTSRCVNNRYFKVLRNFSEHNLESPIGKFKINNPNNSDITSRTLGINKNVSHNIRDVNQAFVALAEAYKERGRVAKSNITDILENLDLSNLQGNQDILLLQCCGHIIADESLPVRTALCKKVWKKLEECGIHFDVHHYNECLKVCIENRVHLNFEKFLSRMKCYPSSETYRLLLDCVCEVGDIGQAVKIVEIMKNEGFPADERLFNALVLGHAIKGGLTDAQQVRHTMITAQVPVSDATSMAIIRGLAWHNDEKQFLQAVRIYPNVIHEPELLKLFMDLGLSGNYTWFHEMLKIIGSVNLSRQGIQQLELICVNLIHSGQPEAAIMYYTTFVEFLPTQSEGMYAYSLLVELLHSLTPIKIICELAGKLKDLGLNPVALDTITGVALRRGLTKTGWELLEVMPNLRPHYFWPLLLKANQQEGEAGIFSTLKKMMSLKVWPDLDTVAFYTIPFCDSTDPKQLLTRLQDLDFTVRELLTPLVSFLLKENRIEPAQNMCKTYKHVPLYSERLLKPLVMAWAGTGDSNNVVDILQKICESRTVNTDYLGQFLVRALKTCRSPANHENFLLLLKAVAARQLYISITVSDLLMYWLKSPIHSCTCNADIRLVVDSLVNASIEPSSAVIPHPRHMSVVDLENHLIELRSKNMDTRGVLRRLIQEHCRLGSELKVNQLREQFLQAGYKETPGMMSALLYTYVLNNNVSGAINVYHEIKSLCPDFVVDDFKILDLATLLVTNNQFEMALNILIAESEKRNPRGGSAVVRNCWKLISAASNETNAKKLFRILVDRGYCVPSNIILGPLVKVHLKKGDLYKAVEVFTEYAQQYNCTPLQLEVLCAVVKGENEQLLQEALDVVSKIHGPEAATVSLISALAESRLHKSLQKFLLESRNVPKKQIERRCERWVTENKLFALETLAQAVDQVPSDVVDRSFVHHSIMKLHSKGRNNDCESAVAFYRHLLEKEKNVPETLVDELLRLVTRCKYEMPEIVITKGVG